MAKTGLSETGDEYPASRWIKFCLRSLLLICLAVPATEQAFGQDYQFTLIADTTGPLNDFKVGAAINLDGNVQFQASLNAGGEGLFIGNGGSLTTIAETGTVTSQGVIDIFEDTAQGLNSLGFSAFQATVLYNGGQSSWHAVFSGDGTTLNVLAPRNNPVSYGGPVINDSGTLILGGGVASGTDIFTNGPSSVYSSSNTPFSRFGAYDINNSGTMVFGASGGPGHPGNIVVGTAAGAPITIVVTDGDAAPIGGTFDHLLSASINDQGHVLFEAGLDTGDGGLFVWDGLSLTTIALADRQVIWDIMPDAYALNDQGQVAYAAILKDDNSNSPGLSGLFVSDGGNLTTVLMEGDSLFGTTVTGFISFPFNRHGLNDHGELAFAATLADGRRAIVRASPTAIPEPNTVLFPLLAVTFLITRRRGRLSQAKR